MVLLEVLTRLASTHGWRLTVAHFNHQLRGRSSDADEKFVRDAAEKLGLPVIVGRANVRGMAARQKLSVEMAARMARHEFFARAAKSRGMRSVALAHHADDQVELFLLRLLRGAGTEGLAGMKWLAKSPASDDVTLARPLLDQTRKSLAQYARTRKIRYREDATNAQTDFLRNRVRHKLIPFLKREFQPALEKVLRRQMEILGAESEFLNDAAGRWVKSRRRGPFEKLSVAMQRRCLQMQMLREGITVNFELLEKIRQFPNRAAIAEGGVVVLRDDTGRTRIGHERRARFSRETASIELKNRPGEMKFGGAIFKWKLEKMSGGTFRAPTRQENLEAFDARKAGNCMVLRYWKAGDRFQPLGMGQAMKLQDLFTNAKIPRLRRREMVVATTETGEIMWVEGLRPGERFKLDKSTTHRLNWHWKRG